MKILDASEPGLGSTMTEDEVKNFLSTGKRFVRLGTIDDKGDPNVHPVWYYFDGYKLYFETSRSSRKAQNIRNRDTVYFCIDDESVPYKGVRGKGIATISENVNRNVLFAEKLVVKYTGSLENKMAKFLMHSVMSGESVIVEISPLYFATWDQSKGMSAAMA
ncbi:MAG: pyridoxamine 5'-phosphate oxidase family protein [Thermoproteota archaeon]